MIEESVEQASENVFKIGLFAANCSGGIAATNVKERWQPTWQNNLDLAQMADKAGLEFMLPLGRWADPKGCKPQSRLRLRRIKKFQRA